MSQKYVNKVEGAIERDELLEVLKKALDAVIRDRNQEQSFGQYVQGLTDEDLAGLAGAFETIEDMKLFVALAVLSRGPKFKEKVTVQRKKVVDARVEIIEALEEIEAMVGDVIR